MPSQAKVIPLGRPRLDPAKNDHYAEDCKDPNCPRFPCRLWKEAYRRGYDDGYADGWADGYAAGQAAGYAAGFAAGLASAGAGAS